MDELVEKVLAAAMRIANDDVDPCLLLPPCAANDDACRCVRLAKLALDVSEDCTAAYDASVSD